MKEVARGSNRDFSWLYRFIPSKDDIAFFFYGYVSSNHQPVYRMIGASEDEGSCKRTGFYQQVIESAKHGRKTRPYGNMGQIVLEVE